MTSGIPAQTYNLAITPGEDTTISGVSGADHEIFARLSGGGWAKIAATLSSALPPESEIDAISFLAPNQIYFSVDSDVILGATTYADEDVIFWNGSTFALFWDGSANGLPAEADLDALEIITVSPLNMVLSLNSDALLTIGGTPNSPVADEDLFVFVTGSGFTTIIFDGSAEGVPPEADLDAVDYPAANTFLLSFDIPAVIGALTFDDADLVQWDSVTTNFALTPVFVASGEGFLPEVDLRAAESSNLNTATPTPSPTRSPTPSPTRSPTPSPTRTPTASPTRSPTPSPTRSPTPSPTRTPTASPTTPATSTPTPSPTPSPTPLDDAAFVTHNMPAQIPASHGVPLRVTLSNTGNTNWTPGEGYSLGASLDTCNLIPSGQIALPGGADIAPGATHQFQTLVNVPGTLGPCSLDLRMKRDGSGFFGPTLSLTPQIVAPVNNATMVTDTIPPTFAPNQGWWVGITVRNTGNTPWYAGSNYSLAVIGSPCMIPAATRFYLVADQIVMPNETHHFPAYITAPGSLGPCNIQFQMVEEFVAFFGQILNKNINVANPANAARTWDAYE